MKYFRLLGLIALDILVCSISLYLSYSIFYQEYVSLNNIDLSGFIFSSLLLIIIFLIQKIYSVRLRFIFQENFSFYINQLLVHFLLFFLVNNFLIIDINNYFNLERFYGARIPNSVLIINTLTLFLLLILSRMFIKNFIKGVLIFIDYKKNSKQNILNKRKNKICFYNAGNLVNITY